MIKIIADEKKGNTKIESNGMMGDNVSMLLESVESFFVECVKGLPSELQHKFIEDLGDSFDEILEKLEDIADGKEDKEVEEDDKTENFTGMLKELQAMREKLKAERKELEKKFPKEVIEAAEKTAKEMFEAMLKKAKEQADGDK